MTRRPSTPGWFAGAALVWLVAATPMSAQRSADVRGIVIDSVSGEPIARVHIDVFEQPRSGPRISRGETLTDVEGRFRIGVAARSSAMLEVRQIGFTPRDIILDVSRLQDTLIIALARTATSLGEVRIFGKTGHTQRQLAVSGYFDRRKVGIGHFLDSTRVARSNATTVQSLLRPYLKGCTMIFVDGVPGRLGDVEISQVIGIEIYGSNTEAPPMFYNRLESTSRCGSIVVWR